MGIVSVSLCRCMFVSCVHPVAVLITALYAAMSVSFCLSHPVAVSVFMICRGVCVCVY